MAETTCSNNVNEDYVQFNCAQFNLGKRRFANIQTNEWLSKHQAGLALCQEPNQKRGKIMLISSEVTQFTGGPAPRACILMSKQLSKHFLKVNQLCSNDQVVTSTRYREKIADSKYIYALRK